MKTPHTTPPRLASLKPPPLQTVRPIRLSNRPHTARPTATPPIMTMTIALRFVRKAATPTLIILGAFIPRTGKAQSADYTAPRTAVVNAAGARVIRISAGAGYLNVTGRTGINQVRVTGVARAPRRRILEEIKLQAERQGDEWVIKVITPDNDNSLWDVFRGDWHQQLDLDIDVPINTPLQVEEGSGEL